MTALRSHARIATQLKNISAFKAAASNGDNGYGNNNDKHGWGQKACEKYAYTEKNGCQRGYFRS